MKTFKRKYNIREFVSRHRHSDDNMITQVKNLFAFSFSPHPSQLTFPSMCSYREKFFDVAMRFRLLFKSAFHRAAYVSVDVTRSVSQRCLLSIRDQSARHSLFRSRNSFQFPGIPDPVSRNVARSYVR